METREQVNKGGGKLCGLQVAALAWLQLLGRCYFNKGLEWKVGFIQVREKPVRENSQSEKTVLKPRENSDHLWRSSVWLEEREWWEVSSKLKG